MTLPVSALWLLLMLYSEGSARASPFPLPTSLGAMGAELPQTNSSSELESPSSMGDTMAHLELEPDFFPAQRAAKVAVHYLNTLHGSPFNWISLDEVHNATLEDLGHAGGRYHVVFTIKPAISNVDLGRCSAEVLFPGEDKVSRTPQVECSCDDLQELNATAHEEEAFYQQLSSPNTPSLSGSYLPDSHGHVPLGMQPLWYLGAAAASFVMLRESNESTLYNMAQVANFTQLESMDGQLRFQYTVLLHDMVSQEILAWKLLVSWSPGEGVRVHHAEWEPCSNHRLPNFSRLTPKMPKTPPLWTESHTRSPMTN